MVTSLFGGPTARRSGTGPIIACRARRCTGREAQTPGAVVEVVAEPTEPGAGGEPPPPVVVLVVGALVVVVVDALAPDGALGAVVVVVVAAVVPALLSRASASLVSASAALTSLW